jgi:hypothetical protein
LKKTALLSRGRGCHSVDKRTSFEHPAAEAIVQAGSLSGIRPIPNDAAHNCAGDIDALSVFPFRGANGAAQKNLDGPAHGCASPSATEDGAWLAGVPFVFPAQTYRATSHA